MEKTDLKNIKMLVIKGTKYFPLLQEKYIEIIQVNNGQEWNLTFTVSYPKKNIPFTMKKVQGKI